MKKKKTEKNSCLKLNNRFCSTISRLQSGSDRKFRSTASKTKQICPINPTAHYYDLTRGLVVGENTKFV